MFKGKGVERERGREGGRERGDVEGQERQRESGERGRRRGIVEDRKGRDLSKTSDREI